MADPILEARDVRLERNGSTILDGISLTVEPTERVLIQGRSGAGKTSLFRILGLLEYPTDGVVLVDGTDAASISETKRAALRRDELGFIFQTFRLVPDLTAWENARLPQEHAGASGPGEHWLDMVFDQLEISDLADRYPATLSGGEQQRVAIARALANRPSAILADEPTGQLDPETTSRVLELLFEVHESAEAALVVVSHDTRLTREFPTSYWLTADGVEPTRPGVEPSGWLASEPE